MTVGAQSTQSESLYEPGPEQKPVPGALLVFSGNAPMLRPIRVAPGPVRIGRDDAGGQPLPDEKVSRPHAELVFDGPGWTVADLDSRNGTWLDGRKLVGGEHRASSNAVVRMAHSLFILTDDVRPFVAGTVSTQHLVVGPTLKAPLDRIAVAARGGARVLIGGENGSGKENAARVFHEAAAKDGPFIAVNCAAIPAGLAERLLFGAVKGAYNEAKTDAEGYVQAANGGTLFLDEVGDLDLAVQAKLLRVLETQEVMPLGASTTKKVSVRFCAATNVDLRRAVEAKTFRQDLFYRLAEVEVKLPALRERREEIPWLIAQVLSDQAVRTAHVSLVEAVLLRTWPGNVRELVAQVRKAAVAAHAAGKSSVRAEHLDPEAGRGATREAAPRVAASPSAPGSQQPTKEEVERALTESGGKRAAAARALNLQRTQLYRLLDRYGLKGGADDPAE